MTCRSFLVFFCVVVVGDDVGASLLYF